MHKSTDRDEERHWRRSQVVWSEGFASDPQQEFLGKEFRLLDRYELQELLVETLAQTKHHRRKAAACADCHRTFRHWRCRNNHDWAEAENSCSVRVCPHCCCRRSRVLASRIDKFLLGREQAALRYVVLSERNSENVAEGMELLWASWTRLRRSVRWKRKVKGCVVALEVTYNREENTWHPHLNVIFEGEYFPQEELRQLWIEATQHRGEIVWISAVNQGTTREMIKYVTKISDLIGHVEALDKLLTAVHKKRFVRTYGSFYGLSVADEDNPVQGHCPDCESTELVALGRVKPQQVSIDFAGVLRVERPPGEVGRDFGEAESFRPGLFLRHKYAPRPGHERTPAWAKKIDESVKKYADEQRTSLRQPSRMRSSTTMATAPTTMKPRRELQEVKAPEMFKFTKQGETLSGVLLSIEPTMVREKPAIEYMLLDDRGQRLTFLGTNDLDKKIQPGHIGHWLDIRYERDDSSFQKPGQSVAKIFKVLVSKEKEPGF